MITDDLATKGPCDVFAALNTSESGLTEEQAAARLADHGPNEVAREKHHTWLYRLYTAARNPLVILLTVLAAIAYATEDFRAGTLMLLIVFLGLSLRFVQESRANAAAEKLRAMNFGLSVALSDSYDAELFAKGCRVFWK